MTEEKTYMFKFLCRRRRCNGIFTFLGSHRECDSSPFTFIRKRRRI